MSQLPRMLQLLVLISAMALVGGCGGGGSSDEETQGSENEHEGHNDNSGTNTGENGQPDSGEEDSTLVVDAGADQSVNEGEEVTLRSTVNSTHPVNSYLWTQSSGPIVVLNQTDTQVTSFTAPTVESDLVLEFAITVADEEGHTVSDWISVMVTDSDGGSANEPFLVDAGPDQRVQSEDQVTLNATTSVPDEEVAGTSWIQTNGTGVTLANTGTLTPTFMAPQTATEEALEFLLTVITVDGMVAEDRVRIIVNPYEGPFAGNVSVLAAEDVQAPGLEEGTLFTDFRTPSIGKDGFVAFSAGVSSGPGRKVGIWGGLPGEIHEIIGSGDSVLESQPNVRFSSLKAFDGSQQTAGDGRIRVTDSKNFSFVASVFDSISSGRYSAVVTVADSSRYLLFPEKQRAPGFPEDIVIHDLWSLAASGSSVLVQAEIGHVSDSSSFNYGLWKWEPDKSTLIAASTPTLEPGDPEFFEVSEQVITVDSQECKFSHRRFSWPQVNEKGTVVFFAQLEPQETANTCPSHALFKHHDGQLTVLLKPGMPVPGMAGFTFAADFQEANFQPFTLGNDGRVIFRSTISDGQTPLIGTWVINSTGSDTDFVSIAGELLPPNLEQKISNDWYYKDTPQISKYGHVSVQEFGDRRSPPDTFLTLGDSQPTPYSTIDEIGISSLRVPVTSGQEAPGIEGEAYLAPWGGRRPWAFGFRPSLNDHGTIAFTSPWLDSPEDIPRGGNRGDGFGLWIANQQGSLIKKLSTQDRIIVDGLSPGIVELRFLGGPTSGGLPAQFSDSGDTVLWSRFDDDKTAILLVE